jgi:hypothetical protein
MSVPLSAVIGFIGAGCDIAGQVRIDCGAGTMRRTSSWSSIGDYQLFGKNS